MVTCADDGGLQETVAQKHTGYQGRNLADSLQGLQQDAGHHEQSHIQKPCHPGIVALGCD